MGKPRSSSSSVVERQNLSSLFNLSTMDIADGLSATLETESKSHYQPCDYLSYEHAREQHHQQPRRERSVHSTCSAATKSTSASSRAESHAASRAESRRSSRSSRTTSSTHYTSSRRSSSSSAKGSKESITPASRSKIVQWLYDCVDYLELPRECAALAMRYVDRFMSTSTSLSGLSKQGKSASRTAIKTILKARADATVYQLIGLSSLFLAAKQHDKMSVVDAALLVKVSHGSYSVEEIVNMESMILDVLHWQLCDVTSLAVAQSGIALLYKVLRKQSRRSSSSSIDKKINSVIDFTRLQIELSITDYTTSVLRAPSSVAFSAVLNSMDLLDFTPHEKRAFSNMMYDLVGVKLNTSRMDQVRDELHEVFDLQSDTVLGRASSITSQEGEGKNGSMYSNLSCTSPVGVESDVASRRRSSRKNGQVARRDPSSSRGEQRRRKPLEP